MPFMALVVLGILLVFAGCSQGSESSGGTATSSVASVKIVAIDAVNQLRSDCSSATYTGGGDGGVLAARVDNDIVLYTPDWFTSTMEEASFFTGCAMEREKSEAKTNVTMMPDTNVPSMKRKTRCANEKT